MWYLVKQLFINKWRIKAPNCKFGLLSRVGNESYFEGNNRVGKMSFVNGRFGKYTYVGDNVTLFDANIGRFTSISSNVHLVNGRHPIKSPYVSTSPVFFAKQTPFGVSFVQESIFEEYSFLDKDKSIQVIIGNDCWIGYGVSIVGGIRISDGAVVLANATVTKDVPPYAIVGGVPAKVIGYRYDDEIIEKLLSLRWWDKDDAWIVQRASKYCDLDQFLK